MSAEKCSRQTKQKALLLEYMKNHRDIHLKAEDILAGLKQQQEAVSKATV